MSLIFENDVIFYLIFAFCVFAFAYTTSDKILNFIYNRSIGNREEVIELLDRMMVETDKKKLTLLLMLLSFGLGLMVFIAVWPNVIFGFILGSAVTIAGWSLPKYYFRALWEKRCNRVVNQMVDGLVIMGNGVGAGLSLTQSMERVVDNIRGPLTQEFRLVLNKVRLGMSVEEALNEFGDRIQRPDVQMLVISINILKETGGNLAETFATIVTVIRERQKIEKKIEAMTAQGKTQAAIMTMVPFILLAIFMAIDPNYVKPLFTSPIGWFALALMLALQIIGGVLMKKIVTIKV